MSDAFLLEAMQLDDVSVGRDGGDIVVSCRDHDGRSEIETEGIHDLVDDHGLQVTNTIVDFDAGEVRHVIGGSTTDD
ncbi:hypothetical protein [Natrinema salsiterrestre]|uniref:Uncharacterized protein n=1 Tax=Natrinema salsiterrestre TaxID=2950540 RepID=A0A9Q4Q1T2_9EURY|nr:hypothetical protein [Natrinema salsiterrestre]MDF9748395.1 hypothetical protein [Natrinema salsiterrestre]